MSRDELVRLAELGSLQDDDLIWKPGFETWKAAIDIPDLHLGQKPLASPPPLPLQQAANKTRGAAKGTRTNRKAMWAVVIAIIIFGLYRAGDKSPHEPVSEQAALPSSAVHEPVSKHAALPSSAVHEPVSKQAELPSSATPLTVVMSQIGCDSGINEEMKADMFQSQYANRWMQTEGVVSYLPSAGKVGITVHPATMTYDLLAEFDDPHAAYNLKKGQRITIRYIMRDAGGCFLPFSGDHAHIVR